MALTADNVQLALADFIDNRVLPAINEDNSALKWMIGGVSAVGLARLNEVVRHYRPLLNTLGFIDEQGNFMIDAIEMFLNASFQKQEILRMPLLGVPFRFDRTDGQYLIEALKRHGG